MKEVNSKFAHWACSYAGCDGGNPESDVWLCGIESGLGKKQNESAAEYELRASKYYSETLVDEINRGPQNICDYTWKETLAYPFGRSVAKLMLAIGKVETKHYSMIESAEVPLPFTLNLFPIGFQTIDGELWKRFGLADTTGLESKDAYRTWCFVNRFPFFSNEVEKHRPKLIICLGLNFLLDFFVCFGGTTGCGNIHTEQLNAVREGQPPRRFVWSKLNGHKTTLAVIPFFSSQAGINSDALIVELGSRLAAISFETKW